MPASAGVHIRPETANGANMVGVAAKLLIPFLLGYLVWAGAALHRHQAAVESISQTAMEIAVKLDAMASTAAVDVVKLADEFAARRVGDAEDRANERRRYHMLVRVVALQLLAERAARSGPGQDGVDAVPQYRELVPAMSERWRDELRLSSGVPQLFQLLLLLIFPTFFLLNARAAAARLQEGRVRQSMPRSFAERIQLARDSRFVQNCAEWQLLRRFLLALLLGFALTWLFAPLGLKASLIVRFSALHAPAGAISQPSWLESFTEAPFFVFGFAGFYLYALTAMVGRYFAGDLSARFVLALVVRGITVGVISLLLAALAGDDGGLSRSLAFAVGIFPSVGLQIVAKATQAGVDSVLPDRSASFTGIPEIDLWKQSALREVGVGNVHDLAQAEALELFTETGLRPKLLMRSIDRALLISVMGLEPAQKLDTYQIRTASELVLHLRGIDAFISRWVFSGAAVPTSAQRFKLTAAEAKRRKKAVEDHLGMVDVDPQVESLVSHGNTAFILDNRVAYEDL